MYKRIAKRIERHEREDKLGITEEEKEILGLNDTDSDESDSEESDDQGDDSEASVDGEDNSAELEISLRDAQESDHEDEEDEIESLGDLIPPMPIDQALKSPLYDFLATAKGQGCVICPGKILASENAANLHINALSHKRRLKRFQIYIAEARKKGEAMDTVDASVIVQKMDENLPHPPDKAVVKPKRKARQHPVVGSIPEIRQNKPKVPKTPNRKMRRAALLKAKGGEAAKAGEQDGEVTHAKVDVRKEETAKVVKAKPKQAEIASSEVDSPTKPATKRKHLAEAEGQKKSKKRKTKTPTA
ncbi:hypothetical protein CALVIDRAFT_533510 [Calocera viscosa TUFC12733]|uniref:Uncharacterized protein n=1 Tax=Calocera viscosa (strain TUFC12733) TaxID=1330018 RepID=A0A167R2W9_CALVF|nr:hypothetical protein CALVIDRAFT_533510 [Calocera viscosa TUFC12733]